MVKVKRPLIVQPSLPRFLAPGDECQMDVTVFNEIGKDITAKLRITCGGPLSTTVNEQDIAIAKGGSASVSIPMVAGNLPGKGLCTVSCEAETVRYSDTIEIAVRPPISAEVVADSGSLAPGKSIVISAPGQLAAGIRGPQDQGFQGTGTRTGPRPAIPDALSIRLHRADHLRPRFRCSICRTWRTGPSTSR